MRIRWKLLILLLIIALVPLVIVRVSDVLTALRLGHEQAARFREQLLTAATDSLQRIVDNQAATIGREGQLIKLMVHQQAEEAARFLAAPPPADPGPILFSADYDKGVNLPDDMAPSPRHLRHGPGDCMEPIEVSHKAQVFQLAPGVQRDAVTDDLARLNQMVPIYQALLDADRGLVYWQYTSLENGVHSCYPGHGGYPDDYDPRQRVWYQRVRELGKLAWSAPYVDVSSGEFILTCGAPLYDAKGDFRGATAIDVRVAGLIDRVKELPLMVTECEVMLVAMAAMKEGEPKRLLVLGRRDFESRDRDWRMPTQFEWLEADAPEATQTIHDDIINGRSMVRTLPYQGRRCVWAYGVTSDRQVAFIIIVHEADIVAQATAIERQMIARTWHEVRRTGLVFLSTALLLIVLAALISRRITRPIRELAGAADRIAEGDLDARAPVDRKDELGELAHAFNDMVPQLRDRMRLRESLNVAMEVQQHLLPQQPPQVPGLDIAGHSIYCDETGGDYYDFLELARLGPRTLGVAVGDVTGHGIAAALLMTAARALLRSHCHRPGSLAEMMNLINRHLTDDTPVGRFMTLYYLVIDADTRQARWTSAGHDAAIRYQPGADRFDELAGSDIPLGIQGEWTYNEFGPEPLRAGEILVIGTDGIWESQNDQGRMFGKDALRQLIRENADKSADLISRTITAGLASFRGGHPQEDDVTLVVIKVLPC